ncbi:hypothetical protein TWF718_005350 [Orbilia javanica]|uniref:BTB domain-containing protein n=1 Tax=Orbilia javanica TaxID=47235 RepID=A0AAN8MRV3_9PEZI
MNFYESEESIGPPRGGVPRSRIEELPDDYPDDPPRHSHHRSSHHHRHRSQSGPSGAHHQHQSWMYEPHGHEWGGDSYAHNYENQENEWNNAPPPRPPRPPQVFGPNNEDSSSDDDDEAGPWVGSPLKQRRRHHHHNHDQENHQRQSQSNTHRHHHHRPRRHHHQREHHNPDCHLHPQNLQNPQNRQNPQNSQNSRRLHSYRSGDHIVEVFEPSENSQDGDRASSIEVIPVWQPSASNHSLVDISQGGLPQTIKDSLHQHSPASPSPSLNNINSPSLLSIHSLPSHHQNDSPCNDSAQGQDSGDASKDKSHNLLPWNNPPSEHLSEHLSWNNPPSKASSQKEPPSKTSSQKNPPSKVSSQKEFPSKVSSQKELPSKVSSPKELPSKVSSKVSSQKDFPSKLPSKNDTASKPSSPNIYQDKPPSSKGSNHQFQAWDNSPVPSPAWNNSPEQPPYWNNSPKQQEQTSSKKSSSPKPTSPDIFQDKSQSLKGSTHRLPSPAWDNCSDKPLSHKGSSVKANSQDISQEKPRSSKSSNHRSPAWDSNQESRSSEKVPAPKPAAPNASRDREQSSKRSTSQLPPPLWINYPSKPPSQDNPKQRASQKETTPEPRSRDSPQDQYQFFQDSPPLNHSPKNSPKNPSSHESSTPKIIYREDSQNRYEFLQVRRDPKPSSKVPSQQQSSAKDFTAKANSLQGTLQNQTQYEFAEISRPPNPPPNPPPKTTLREPQFYEGYSPKRDHRGSYQRKEEFTRVHSHRKSSRNNPSKKSTRRGPSEQQPQLMQNPADHKSSKKDYSEKFLSQKERQPTSIPRQNPQGGIQLHQDIPDKHPQESQPRGDAPNSRRTWADFTRRFKLQAKAIRKSKSLSDFARRVQRHQNQLREALEPQHHFDTMEQQPKPSTAAQNRSLGQGPPNTEPKPSKDHKHKSDKPPRVPRSAKQPIPSGDSLMMLLRSREFSDVTVIVGTGEDKRIYDLHRNILCTKSEYFQGAIRQLDTDARLQSSSSVVVRDLLPPIFDLVLEWLYGEVLAVERHQPLILALYRAATVLKIHGLRIHIARSVSKMLKHKRKNGKPIHFEGFEVVRSLFEYADTPEYFESLRKCTDEIALQSNIPMPAINAQMAAIGGVGGATAADTKFWMALAVSYQKALHATVCSECRSIVSTKRRTGLDRMCCHCSTSGDDNT